MAEGSAGTDFWISLIGPKVLMGSSYRWHGYYANAEYKNKYISRLKIFEKSQLERMFYLPYAILARTCQT